jgi:hypothetical protein
MTGDVVADARVRPASDIEGPYVSWCSTNAALSV